MEVKELKREVIASIRSSLTISTLAQCVTELVLNSLDAKSTAIAVRVNAVNCQIQVIDTGDGITEQNLRQIGKFYMTNKCHKFSDLHKRSGYFGFRGEALASICNTANSVIVMSRTRDSEETFKRVISLPGSDVVSISPRPSQGTTVTVDGMFDKLPVRKKRFRQDLELEDIKRALEVLLVIHPTVSFTLRNNISGTLLVNSPKQHSVKNALKSLHSTLNDQDLKFFKLTKGQFLIEALLYKNLYHNNKAQFMYVNKRPVQCVQIQKFIAASYQKYFCSVGKKFKTQRAESKNKYPVYVININCPYSECDLMVSSTNNQVNFRNLPSIIKSLERVFSKLSGIEPNPKLERKAGNVSADDFQRSECRVSHIGGAVRGYAYKRKCPSNPKELVTTKDNYDIEDDTRDDFENALPTEMQEHLSKVQKPIQSKQKKKTNNQIVHGQNNEIKVKSKRIKLEKKPLPIRLNSKNSGNQQKGLILPGKTIGANNRKKKRNNKNEKESLPNINNKMAQYTDKSRVIVSQKHADQMAYLVESEIENATKDYINPDISNQSSSTSGKQFLLENFLKGAAVCKESHDSSEDFEERQDFQKISNGRKENPIQPTSSVKMLDIDKSFSTNRLSPLNNSATEICDELDLHSVCIQDNFICQARNSAGHNDVISQNETAGFTLRTNVTHSLDPKLEDSVNFFKSCNINTVRSKSHSKHNNHVMDSKDVTSKYIQTSMSLQKRPQKQRQTATNVNYNDEQELRKNIFKRKMERLVKMNELQRKRSKRNKAQCYDEIRNTIKYLASVNQCLNNKSNGGPSRKKLSEKYSNHDPDCTCPHKVHRRKTDKPYYFSYKDETVKIFDCDKKRPHTFPPRTVASFHLTTDNSQFVPQGILPSCIDNGKFLNSFQLAPQEDSFKAQPMLDRTDSPFSETGLENAILSPISKTEQTPKCQQQKDYNESQPSIRRRCYSSSYERSNVQINPQIAEHNFVQPHPVHKKGRCKTNSYKRSNEVKVKQGMFNTCYSKTNIPEKMKRICTEHNHIQCGYSSNPMNMDRILNYIHPENHLSQQMMSQVQAETPVSLIGNYSGNTTKTNVALDLYHTENFVPERLSNIETDPDLIVKDYSVNTEGINSPETSHLKINFAGLRDTFDLDRKMKSNFLHKNTQLENIKASKAGIIEKTCHKKVRKNVEFNISFLDITTKSRNDTIVNTCLKNTSFSSLCLSFNTSQLKNVCEETFNNMNDKLNTSTSNKLFSLNVDMDNNVSSDLFPTQNKSNYGKPQLSVTVKPIIVQSANERDICNEITHQKTIVSSTPRVCELPHLEMKSKDTKSHPIATSHNTIENPACTSEWYKMLDQFGNFFYFNKRTGMTTFYSPKNESHFTLAPRAEFIPKGLSPILTESKNVDKVLSPEEKQKLQTAIIESYESELLTVKWMDYGIQNDARHFFDALYKSKAKLYEAPVPVANRSCKKSIRFDASWLSNITVVGQVDCKFIAAALSGKTNHIIIFDQHAVHERIRLENLQKEYDKVTWKLRHPVILFLPGLDLELVIKHRTYLSNLGMAFDCLSNCIVVQGIPLCLWRRVLKEDEGNVSYLSEVTQVLVDQVLEIIRTGNIAGHLPPIMDNVIKMEACRGAIKFGQPLSKEVCEELINKLKDCTLPFQCAHGRPTLYPLLQLDKL